MVTGANVFNLVDEAWVPTADGTLISLADVFAGKGGDGLGGNPMQKIALTKFLLAIAQTACPLNDDDAWLDLDPQTLGDTCRAYLERQREAFWLYGARPFLQMPAIAKAKKEPLGAFLPHICTGNTTLLQDMQKEAGLGLPERALLVVVLSGYCLGGKQADNSVVLSPGYTEKRNDKGKPATGKAGAWMGYAGFLHHFLQGQSLLETIKLNLLTREDLDRTPLTGGFGTPPWERMPVGEDCETARALRNSLMGCLVPLSKFLLLGEDDIQCTDGIKYPGHLQNYFNPSIGLKPNDGSSKTAKATALWTNPEKLPWRTLPALLAFLNKESGMDCAGVRLCFQRAREEADSLGIWAGGLAVKDTMGEQKVSGLNDFVDSLQFLPAKKLGSVWFCDLQNVMGRLDALSKSLYGATMAYFKELSVDGKAFAANATTQFWELCNRDAQAIFDFCSDPARMRELEQTFLQYARQVFTRTCPKDTARQLAAWGKTASMVRLAKNKEEAA